MTETLRPRRRMVTKVITVPQNFEKACLDFNEARFFDCHEWLEEIWQEETGEVRDLYKGLIQVAAAFVHLSRGNFTGADRLLQTGAGYLGRYRAEGAMGFDVEAIAADAESMRVRLLAGGPAGVKHLDLTRRPVYAFDRGALAGESRRWGAWGFGREGEPLEMEVRVPE